MGSIEGECNIISRQTELIGKTRKSGVEVAGDSHGGVRISIFHPRLSDFGSNSIERGFKCETQKRRHCMNEVNGFGWCVIPSPTPENVETGKRFLKIKFQRRRRRRRKVLLLFCICRVCLELQMLNFWAWECRRGKKMLETTRDMRNALAENS